MSKLHIPDLTPLQAAILKAWIEGKSLKETAKLLGRSTRGIVWHRRRIADKFGLGYCGSRIDLLSKMGYFTVEITWHRRKKLG